MTAQPTRRALLSGGGLLIAFALAPQALGEGAQQTGGGEGGQGPPTVAPGLPGDLSKFPLLDSWIRVDPKGQVTVFTGKAELGQGIKTALLQLAAEELDLEPSTLVLITADTARTPNEGVTAGSHSMQDSGTAILNAAANVRQRLLAAAAERLDVAAGRLTTQDGRVHAPDGRTLGYGELAASLDLHVAARPDAPIKTSGFRFIGRSTPRVDIPAKLTGGVAYVQDLRLPGMLHARVVRGPSDGTRLKPADLEAVRAAPGVVRLAQDGRFLAVIAEREWTAIQVMRRLQATGWERAAPPLPADPHAALLAAKARDVPIFASPGPPPPPGARTLKARYSRPYLMHGSIGPSCAVALWQDGGVTVWTHSQGVYPLRDALADLLKLSKDKVRCIHAEGAGCYGHNGADDAAADAALAARVVPGRPVRLQWMREQEHGFEPLGPSMVVELEGALVPDGRVAGWRHAVWSNAHNGRPTSGGGLLAGGELDPPLTPPAPKPIPMPEGGGDRNANPLYVFPNARGVYHFVEAAPVRVSALRSLGAHMNVFAIESFMDELAASAGADPVAFRLQHLQDERARAVIELAAARFGWSRRPRGVRGRGSGFAFARYKNLGAYCAVALDADVDDETGDVRVRRVAAAVDSGEAVNPDGLANQIEGAIVQSLSWTTCEAVGLDAEHRTSFDWSAYPILRFEQVPDSVDVHILNRPGQPFLGAGEAGQGPTAAALANAVSDAVGLRIRDMPLSPERLRAALPV